MLPPNESLVPTMSISIQTSKKRIKTFSHRALLGSLLAFTLAIQSSNAMPVTVPAKIQAEDYSNFSDETTGNTGGAYRNDNVDIQVTSDTDGGFNVGWITASEWLEYEVIVPSTSSYILDVRVASKPGGGNYSVLIDGTQADQEQAVGATGDWQNYITQSLDLGTLVQGSHTLRVYANAGNFNINWLEIKAVAANVSTNLPGRIEVENYQRALDLTVGNRGGELRNDDVDIRKTADTGGCKYR